MRNRGFLMLLIAMMFSCSQEKKTDWRFSLDKNSKEPYGCFLAYQNLKQLFPSANISSGRNIMKEVNEALKEKSLNRSNRLSIVVSTHFYPDSLQLDKLLRYVHLGNTVCIVAENFSDNILQYFHANINHFNTSTFTGYREPDTIAKQQISLIFNRRIYDFDLFGMPLCKAFTIDTSYKLTYYYLGYQSQADSPNVLLSNEKEGNFIISSVPLAFTNHFLLQNNHRSYYEYFLSFFDQYPATVTWYSNQTNNLNEDADSSLSELLKFPPLFYAFILMMILMLIYILFEGRRRQRSIDKISANQNASLEFAETVGMLYFNKRDHKNLSDKMILHYLESIRSKYGLKTSELNETFVGLLALKLNFKEEDTSRFISYLNYIRSLQTLTEIDIKQLDRELKKFI